MLGLVSHFSFTKQVGLEQELERKGKKRPSCLTYQFWFCFPIWFPSQSDAKLLSSVSLTQLLVSKVVKQWSLGGAVGLHSAHTRSTTSCYCNIRNIFLGFPCCAWTMVMNGRWYEDQANRPTKLTHALAFQNVWWLPNCAVGWKWCKPNKSSYWSNGYWHHNQCCQVLDQSPYDRLEVLLGNAAQGNKKTPQKELSNPCSIYAGFIGW